MTLIIKMHKSLVIFSLTLMLNMMVLFIFLQSWINSNLFELIHLNKNMERNERSTHWLLKILCQYAWKTWFAIVVGGGCPLSYDFLWPPPHQNWFPPMGCPPAPHLEMKPPRLKNKLPIETWNTLPWNDSYKKHNK